MTTTATYMPDLSRVRVAFTGFGSAVDHALIERSTDGIRWETVRGGEQVPVTSGSGHLDDFEFTAGVLNTYRVSGVDSGPIVSVPTPGTTVTGNNVSVTPPLPASGLLDGDALYLYASIGNASVGTVNTPAGWTRIVDIGNVALFSRRYSAGVTAPTVTFTGGVANAETMAQITAFHNADPAPRTAPTQVNASAQNVALPALNVDIPATLNLWAAWKADAWTSAASGRGFAEIGDWSVLFGTSGSSMWWEYTVQGATDIDFGAATLTVTGGVAAASRSAALVFGKAPYVTQQTATITPQLVDADGVERVWLKNLRLSYQNTALTDPVGYLTIQRTARRGMFTVVGRSNQVAITDKRSGKSYALGAHVDWDSDERSRIDFLLASGDVLFLHVPPGKIRLDSMYVSVGDDQYDDEASTFTLPLDEVAAPDPSIAGATITCADILATYATCADLLLAKATCADVLDSIGDPGNVITP